MTEDREHGGSDDLTQDEVYESLDPLEPYTTGEVADRLEEPKRIVRRLLNALYDEDEVRKKNPESGPAIWIREPPKHTCPNCGHEFKIRFLHPVLSSVQYCPRCGTRIP